MAQLQLCLIFLDIIGTLEAIKLTQQESIHGLEEQMRELKKRLQDVEGEKSALLNNQSDENSKLLQQLKIVSKVKTARISSS